MRTMRRTTRLLAILGVLALVAAACGDGDDAEPTTEATSAPETTDAAATAAGGMSLAEICPNPLVIQLDWEPEAEHGGIYELVGDGYEIDVDQKSVTGPLVAGGEETDIDVQVRIGGFAVGFQPVQSLLYQDTDIFMGFVRLTETMASNDEVPIVNVMATFEKSAFGIYWDPATYPNVEEIADLQDEGVTVLLGRPDVFQDYWIAEGIMDLDQMDLTDQPKPAAFVGSGGEVAEAGFATAEPYIYEVEVPEWGKPVKTQLIHDTGFREYFQSLGVREADATDRADCLAAVVPMIQQAHVDYLNNPAETNALILDLVDQYDTGWVYSQGVADFAVDTMNELGIMGNGDNETIGDYDLDRVQELLDIIARVTDTDVSGLSPDELVTNEFIDTSIGR